MNVVGLTRLVTQWIGHQWSENNPVPSCYRKLGYYFVRYHFPVLLRGEPSGMPRSWSSIEDGAIFMRKWAIHCADMCNQGTPSLLGSPRLRSLWESISWLFWKLYNRHTRLSCPSTYSHHGDLRKRRRNQRIQYNPIIISLVEINARQNAKYTASIVNVSVTRDMS